MPVDLPEALRRRLEAAGLGPFTASSRLAGDVSPRRYYRVESEDGTTAIVASYPPELADRCAVWLATSELLRRARVRVPAVLAVDCDAGWMALEDAGERTVAELADRWEQVPELLAAAVEAARRISDLAGDGVAALNPRLATDDLRAELRQTEELVLGPRRLVPESLRRDFDDLLGDLARRLGTAPPRPCHRDLMARNLMPSRTGELVVLDHQDLRLGPPAYDLASLLNDTLYASPELEREILDRLRIDGEARLAYHRAAAQRCLKIAGTFESFRRRGHDRHVPLIDPSLAAAARHLARLPEAASRMPDLVARWPSC